MLKLRNLLPLHQNKGYNPPRLQYKNNLVNSPIFFFCVPSRIIHNGGASTEEGGAPPPAIFGRKRALEAGSLASSLIIHM
jgi:hypothetical protein